MKRMQELAGKLFFAAAMAAMLPAGAACAAPNAAQEAAVES